MSANQKILFNAKEFLVKQLILSFLFVSLFINTALAGDISQKTVNHLQAVSVTVVGKHGSGSGIVKTRKRGDERVSFVFTAAHVVDDLRTSREVIDGKTGTKRTIVTFKDAQVTKTLVENGRTVGKTEIYAEIIRYSSEEDLRVRQKNFTQDSVQFYLDATPVNIGTTVCHVGSFLGSQGSASMSVGIISQLGRLIESKVFDQTTCTAFPGSSGGGVFLEDGRLIGQVLRASGNTFVYFAPSRRIIEWAKQASVEWAVDDKIPLPTDAELRKLPIEDNGAIFSAATLEKKKLTKDTSYRTLEYTWDKGE